MTLMIDLKSFKQEVITMATRDDYLEYQNVPEISNINCFIDKTGRFMIEADFDGGDYAILSYIDEYGEYTVEDPYIGLVISTPNLDEAVDEFCSFYKLSPEDCQYVHDMALQLEETTPITSAEEIDRDFDIFMLMCYMPDLGPDTMGMEGDQFDCYGKFFAKDLPSAKRELETIKTKYPWIDNFGGQIYVADYSEYYDSATREEQDEYGNPYDVDNNVFYNLEALVEYLGWDEQPYYYGKEDESEGLPFDF